MGAVSHQLAQRALGKVVGLKSRSDLLDPITKDDVPGSLGDAPHGAGSAKSFGRNFLSLAHGKNSAPDNDGSVTSKRRKPQRKNCNRLQEAKEMLRRLVIRFVSDEHPVKTAESVEAEYGISARSFYGWKEGRPPSIEQVLALSLAHGSRFVKAVIHPIATAKVVAERMRKFRVRAPLVVRRKHQEA